VTPLFRGIGRRSRHIPRQRQPVERSRSPEEAAKSIQRERAKLEHYKSQTPGIVALGTALRELHEENHIVAKLTAIIGGRT
jgi:hypothetical protein